MQLIQPATSETRTWTADSRNWDHYEPRPDDIIIATYPKCGTTWMQRIVGMMVLQSTTPVSLMEVSPWIDRRSEHMLQDYLATIKAQQHRRFLKTHLRFNSLPIYDEVKYIHVTRDGRDALLSWYHFCASFPPEYHERMDNNGLSDELIGKPMPRVCETACREFHRWLTQAVCPDELDGTPNDSYFRNTESWWQQRHLANVLLIHFDDLKLDLAGEMQRIAKFLDIQISNPCMDEYVEAAGFSAMKRDGKELLPVIGGMLKGGADSFLRKGESRQWETIFDPSDLDLYEHKISTQLSEGCAEWVRFGRLGSA